MNKRLKQHTILLGALMLLLSVFSQPLSAQQKTMYLNEVITLAQKQSPDALRAKHQLIAAYWEYKTFKRGLMPQLVFSGTLPYYTRSIDEILQDNGTQSFQEVQNLSYSASLDLQKRIGLTGANVYLSSSLQSYQNIDPTSPFKNYLSTPVKMGINQPLFDYNPYRWSKQIEPLKYKKAKRAYLEANEQVALVAVGYYFNLLNAQIKVKMTRLNEANYDTLYKIAQGRFASGKIAEDELLQLELKLLQSRTDVEDANLNLENAQFQFKSYLRLPEGTDVALIIPVPQEINQVNTEMAINYAIENSSYLLALEQQMLEAKSNVNRARTQNGFNANLFMEFGLTKSDPNFRNIYIDPNDKQNVRLGVTMPILDWGLREGQVKLAESQMEIVRTDTEQKQIDYRQSIYLQAAEYNMQNTLLTIAAKSDTVASRSYELTKNRYIIGKLNVVELNIAQNNRDQSELAYIGALQQYWVSYFTLRKMTLYDFDNNMPIILKQDDFEDL
jgi:outer membrane protein TolC